MPIRLARASSSSGSGWPVSASARSSNCAIAASSSGLNVSTRARDSSAALSSNEGFSVVAPISEIEPSSMTGRKESCCARLKRWISSTNSTVRRPCARRWRAASNSFFRSATPVWIADTWTNSASACAPTSRATVVLPVPGGPQKIIEPSESAASSRVSAPSGPVRCAWPATSESWRGRSRSASGAAVIPPVRDACRNASASTQATIASATGAARMPTQGSWRPLVTMSVSSPARVTVWRGCRIDEVGLTARRATIGWPVEMPPSTPPAWLDRKRGRAVVAGAHLVGVFLAGQRGGGEAVADLDALDRVDAHQRGGDLRVELAVDRRAPTRRRALRDDFQHRPDRGARLADRVEVMDEAPDRLGVRREERIARDLVPIPMRAVDDELAHLHQRGAHLDAGNHLARDRAGGDPRGGLARRGAPAAAKVANPVFRLVGEVGVSRPVLVFDVAVVLGALIDVLDVDADRRAGRHLAAAALVKHHAREDARLVGLLALGGEARGSRPAAVEIGLDVGDVERDQRRAAVDHAADPRPVAFAIGGDPEQMAESVVRHGQPSGFPLSPPPA